MTKRYEDYLEEFVYDTARISAEKLFGRKRVRKTSATTEEKPKENAPNENDAGESTEEDIAGDEADKELVEKKENVDEDEKQIVRDSSDDHENKNTLTRADIQSLGLTKEDDNVLARIEQMNDYELDKLLKETMEKQRDMSRERNDADAAKRKEYESVHEAISGINNHIIIFLLLLLVAILNFPVTLSWAKNYHYSRKLESEPSLIPGAIIIVSLGVIWQFNTPRNVHAYRLISVVLYVLAAFCLIYCQDSLYRLNSTISTAFAFFAIHQIFSPTCRTLDIDEDELKERIEKMKEWLRNRMLRIYQRNSDVHLWYNLKIF